MSDMDEPFSSLDVMGSGGDTIPLADRVRGVWRDSVQSCLRARFRSWLFAGCVLLAGVSALVLWPSTRPPEAASVIRVGLVPLPSDHGVPLGLRYLYQWNDPGSPGAAADYRVTARTPGDVLHVVGIEGPGLSPDHAIEHVDSGMGSEVTLGAAFDCTTSAWWTAANEDYRVRVLSTDRNGRVLEHTIPLPAADAWAWRLALTRSCLFSTVDGPRSDAERVPNQ